MDEVDGSERIARDFCGSSSRRMMVMMMMMSNEAENGQSSSKVSTVLSSLVSTVDTSQPSPSTLLSRLTASNSGDLPELSDLQSLLEELSQRRTSVDSRKAILAEHRSSLNSTDLRPSSHSPLQTLSASQRHHALSAGSHPSSSQSPVSAPPRKLKIKSLSRPSLHSATQPPIGQVPPDHELKPDISAVEPALILPPRIDIIKSEVSTPDNPHHYTDDQPTRLLPLNNPGSSAKRKKLPLGKKKRKRNASESILSGSEFGEMVSERDSPDTSGQSASHKIRKIDHGPTSLSLSPTDSISLASRLYPATPPLPKVPPPPLPPSCPPPLPPGVCPPLPILPPPPLPASTQPSANSLPSSSAMTSAPEAKPSQPQSPVTRVSPAPEPPPPPPAVSPIKPVISVQSPLSSEETRTDILSAIPTEVSDSKSGVGADPESFSTEIFTQKSTLPNSQTGGSDRSESSHPLALTVAPDNHDQQIQNGAQTFMPTGTQPSKVRDKEIPARQQPKSRLKFGLSPTHLLRSRPNISSLAPIASACPNYSSKPLVSLISRANTPTTEHTEDFLLPCRSLVPPPPVVDVVPSLPKTQGEVTQDFSKTKAPANQVSIHQFQNWINDNYLRSYGEDDLAFLSSEYSSINGSHRLIPKPSDAPENDTQESGPAHVVEIDETFEVPALGRHYSDVWRDEDLGILPPPFSTQHQATDSTKESINSLAYQPLARTRRSDVTDMSISSEKIELGPMTERLISAIQPPVSSQLTNPQLTLNGSAIKTELANGIPEENKPQVTDCAIAPSGELDSIELEERVIRELKYLGILGDEEIVDWSTREDDEISAALRATQKTLKNQSYVNGRRKARLSEIVKARMGYQEYEQIKEGLDRLIEQGWNKRLRQGPKKKPLNKRKPNKSRPVEEEEDVATCSGPPTRVPLPETLLVALEKRQRFITEVGSMFGVNQTKDDNAPSFTGLPTESIYTDLDGELQLKKLANVC